MHKRIAVLVVCFFIGMAGMQANAQQFGIFDNTADWGQRGQLKVPGSVEVSGQGNASVYTMKGNGDDIWDNGDEGFFVYKEVSGNQALQAKVKWIDIGGENEWAKIGLMIRENAQSSTSKNYYVCLRGAQDLISPQWREFDGEFSNSDQNRFQDDQGNQVGAPEGEIWLRISHMPQKNLLFSEWSRDGVDWHFGHMLFMDLEEPVAFGLAITNHEDNDLLAEAEVSNVEFVTPNDEGIPSVMGERYAPYFVVRNEDLPIDIHINGTDPDEIHQIIEIPPTGWEVSNISHNGQLNNGQITWNVKLTENTPEGMPFINLHYTIRANDSLTERFYDYAGTVDGYHIKGAQNLELIDMVIERSFSPNPFRPGQTGHVTLKPTYYSGFQTDSLAIEERVPDGLTPTNISDDGIWDENTHRIRWFFFQPLDHSLTYDVTLGNQDFYDFWTPDGAGQYSYFNDNQTITINFFGEWGWNQLICHPHPVDSNGDNVISTSEILNAASAWKRGEPEPPLDAVLQGASFWKRGGAYTCDDNGQYVLDTDQ